METNPDTGPNAGTGSNFVSSSKRLARHALVVGENRLQLLLLEVEEEREQVLALFKLGVGIAVFVLLAGIALTALIIVACWQWSPIGALSILVAVYAGIAVFCYVQLTRLRKNWQTFSATLDELRKDRECLDRLN